MYFRRRKCDDPIAQNGGLDCPGCHMDYEICNTHTCAEVKKSGSWTPWMIQVNGSTGDGGQLERRFRFSCKANIADSNNLKVALDKEQTRVCHADGSCQRYFLKLYLRFVLLYMLNMNFIDLAKVAVMNLVGLIGVHGVYAV